MPAVAMACPRYVLLSAVGFVLVASTLVGQRYVGDDLWEHAAVVHEVAAHPLRPDQPVVGGDAAHAFVSPYALLVAALSAATGLDALDALTVAGLVNLVLLATALPRFVRLVTAARSAPFYALLLTLLLWGPGALLWSGFLHLDSLEYVAAYPSTFAFALACHAAADLGAGKHARAVLTWAVVVVVHADAAAFVGVVAGVMALRSATSRDRLLLLATGGSAVLLACLWPWYSVPALLLDGGSAFDASNRAVYEDAVLRVGPALVGVPLLVARLRADRRDLLALTSGLLTAVVVVGYVTGRYALGRELPFVVLTLHVALAARASDCEERLSRAATPARMAAAGSAALALATCLVWQRDALERPWPGSSGDALAADRPPYRTYGALLARLPEHAVVLAAPRTGWGVPATGRRIVAPLHPQAFLDDQERRARDVATFFAPTTPATVRRTLARRYGAVAILVDRSSADPRTVASLLRTHRVLGRTPRMVLLGDPVAERVPRLTTSRAARGADRVRASP